MASTHLEPTPVERRSERGDSELLAAWRAGDHRAGSELLERHFHSLYRFFTSKVGSEPEIEDLVQRTFVGALEGIGRFRGDASVKTWLLAIACNVLRQWAWERSRARRREQDLGDCSVGDLGVGPVTALDLAREHRLLATALRRIPIDSQILLELFYWEKLRGQDIAVILEMPEGTVRGRLTRARKQLRAELAQLARTNKELTLSMEGLETWAERVARVRARPS